MSTQDAINRIDEMIGNMIGPFGEEPECKELRIIKKLLESEPEPGEFTKEYRKLLKQSIMAFADGDYAEETEQEKIAEALLDGGEACDIIDRLTAENEKLKRLCGEIQHFYAGVGTILDADHIRKAYNDSSTKAEIEDILKGHHER